MDGSGREIADFGGTTPELMALAEWLKARGVRSVAMESTGVYWIAPHEILEGQGYEVLLVNTRQLAQAPGRDKKSDPTDCEWIQRLHSCGLLRGSFRPGEDVCMLRTLTREKGTLVGERSDWVRRMQKSLDQMNVRVHRAVSDIDGVTGMAILRAIAGGQRDARELAKLRDPRCRKSEGEIAEQLSGHWREDHLFALQQALKMYDAIEERIGDYQREILRKLESMQREDLRSQGPPAMKNANQAKAVRKRGQEPLRGALYRMAGVDLSGIDGIGVETAQVVLSEYGVDLGRFPSEGEFVSHLKLVPRKPTSAGKPVHKRHRNSASTRLGDALRMAATSLRNSPTGLGAAYRQIARRKGADVAVFAMARRLGTLVYRLLRWGQAYVDEGAEAVEKRYEQARVARLRATAKELGFQLTATA
jgi:transposase